MDNEAQKQRRRDYLKKTGNASAKKYEKTFKGFLVRLYRNMKSRITGVQKKNIKSYLGKELLDKHVFYEWALSNDDYKRLYDDYVNSNYDRKKAPSVDRIDTRYGYSIDNIQFITMSQNSGKDGAKKIHKYSLGMEYLCSYKSIKDAATHNGVAECSITMAASPKYKSSKAGGYIWRYEKD
jgi:hypothetical protein